MGALSVLQHVFPPPRYTTLPSVGLDISDNSLKYMQFEKRHSHDTELEIKYWGDIDIPSGVIERGTIHDLDKMTQILKEVKAICGSEYVRLSLPEERAYLFESEVKRGTPFKEIRGLLEFKLEENVPLSPRDVYFDYDVFDMSDEHIHVTVAVYAKDIITNYYKACLAADLMPLSFEIEAQAVARAAIPRGEKGTNMIVDFGKTRTGIGIVHDGILMYTSTIDVGGRSLSESMRKKYGDVAEGELTDLKNKHGLLNSEEGKDVYKAIKPAIDTIAEELETRIHYWDTRSGDPELRTINRIILCGGSCNLAGLPTYLEQRFEIPTERAQVWQNAFSMEHFVPPIVRRYSYGYATAVGLGLYDFLV